LISQLEQLSGESILAILPRQLFHFAIHAGILLYLFKGTVRDFFRLRSLRVHQALVPLAIVAGWVLVATYLLFSINSDFPHQD